MLTAASCFPTRCSRFFFLLLCSPLLIPLLFVAIPLLCAIEILSRYRSRIAKSKSSEVVFAVAVDEDDMKLRRCEEGCGGCDGGEGGGGSGLLQRYLEDQLILARSVYDCGEDYSEDDGDFQDHDLFRVPLLS
ncbi:unnamed protein product [Cochlearia groenlandica]